MKIALINTTPNDLKGSMQRHAQLLQLSLQKFNDVEINLINLAPSNFLLNSYQHKWRTLRLISGNLAAAFRLKKSYDIYHVLDGSHAYVARFLPLHKTIITAHDIIPYLQIKGKFPGQHQPGRFARLIINQSINYLRKARSVLSVSENTRQDLISAGVNSTKIIRIPLAVESKFFNSTSKHASAHHPFIFHLGNNGFYKNRSGVLKIFKLVSEKSNCKLIMAGPKISSDLLEFINHNNMQDRVELVENPADDDIKSFYTSASLLLFPSIYEGFGWPPLEAMACGCPVVASNAGSLPEVTGPSPSANYDDHQSLANHCLKILNNQEYAQQLSIDGKKYASQFSVDTLGDRVYQAYVSLLNSKS